MKTAIENLWGKRTGWGFTAEMRAHVSEYLKSLGEDSVREAVEIALSRKEPRTATETIAAFRYFQGIVRNMKHAEFLPPWKDVCEFCDNLVEDSRLLFVEPQPGARVCETCVQEMMEALEELEMKQGLQSPRGNE